MRKLRLVSLAAVLAMLLSLLPVTAAAASTGLLIPRTRTGNAPFTDTRNAWCADNVQTVYETGLMAGKTATTFDATSSLTYAQITVITARLHELLNGGDGVFPAAAAGDPWYTPAADYLTEHIDASTPAGEYALSDIYYFMEEQANDPCDRYDFVWYLAAVLPESALTAINAITVLPDVDDEDILRFYNAGILTGSDVYGTFNGLDYLNRGQAAAMLARIVDPSQRVRFTPETLVMSQALLGLDPQTPVLTVDGVTITAETYTASLAAAIQSAETNATYSLYDAYPQELEAWLEDETYLDPFADYLREKCGITATFDWNAPDAGGMTPAQKVRQDVLDDLTEMGVLLSHQSAYPLTSAQRAEIAESLPYYQSYGYSQAHAQLTGTLQTLLENLAATKAVSPSQLSGYLAENGYLYGQYLVTYRGEYNWRDSDAESLAAIREGREKIAAHLDDPDYILYCISRYSDAYDAEPALLGIAELSEANQTTVRNLRPGQLSPVLTEEDRYVVVLKLDPSGDTYVATLASIAEAKTQLTAWAETAQVVPTAAYHAVNVAQVAAKMTALDSI